MKFDGNLAWKQATGMVAGNRELVLALAGVFFFLPSFALTMLVKQPQVAGGTPEQMAAALRPFFATMAPWFVVGTIIQSLGQLTLMGLFGRSRGATVGQALRRGFEGLASYLVVYLFTVFVMSVVLALVLTIGSLVSPVIGLALGVYLVCQAYGRFVTAGAVIMIEDRLNPLTAVTRAVTVTRGNGFRIGNFLFLLAAGFFVAFMVLTILVGIVSALTMGEGRVAEIVSGSVSSAVMAVALAYFVGITVAIYRQLTGDAEQASMPFG